MRKTSPLRNFTHRISDGFEYNKELPVKAEYINELKPEYSSKRSSSPLRNSKAFWQTMSFKDRDQFSEENKSTRTSWLSHSWRIPIEEEEALVNLFKNQIEIQKRLETEKISLAHRHDFNLEDAFRLFDFDGKGFALTHEVSQGLLELGLKPNKTLLYLFMRRYDKYNDGRLRFDGFCNAFTPHDVNSADLLARRGPYHVYKHWGWD